MKKYILVPLFIVIVCANQVTAQDYKTGLGLRGGWTTGISVKHFIAEGKAIEVIVSARHSYYRWRGFQVTGLYEVHKPAFSKNGVEGLFWFYGAGAHFGGGGRYNHWHDTGKYTGYYHHHSYFAFGIDFILGLEYKIPEIPITLGLDVKPFFEFATAPGYAGPYGFWDAALSIRYVF